MQVTGFCLLLFTLYCSSGRVLTSPNAGAGPRAPTSALAASSFLCQVCDLQTTFVCCPCGSLTLGQSLGVSFSVLSGGLVLGPLPALPRQSCTPPGPGLASEGVILLKLPGPGPCVWRGDSPETPAQLIRHQKEVLLKLLNLHTNWC